jgi:anti-sigma regulatory factor (Ser/Thr protein kinase)
MPGFRPQPVPTAPVTAKSGPAVPLVPSHWRFPAEAASVRRARHVVTEALALDLRAHLTDDMALLASELVTNAIHHGTRGGADHVVELVLWPADGHYWLAVSDPGAYSSGRPALARPDEEACGGRGLVLVDALAAAWAVVPRRTRGKSVIAGLPLHGG